MLGGLHGGDHGQRRFILAARQGGLVSFEMQRTPCCGAHDRHSAPRRSGRRQAPPRRRAYRRRSRALRARALLARRAQHDHGRAEVPRFPNPHHRHRDHPAGVLDGARIHRDREPKAGGRFPDVPEKSEFVVRGPSGRRLIGGAGPSLFMVGQWPASSIRVVPSARRVRRRTAPRKRSKGPRTDVGCVERDCGTRSESTP